ncbi:putative esterase [Paraburkholderia sp. UCT70]|uniref:hypothetical protein n=1 Tax=Paraburkholderia sp. UCT70 TaxID=2991068 RepID=UPI003D21ACEC
MESLFTLAWNIQSRDHFGHPATIGKGEVARDVAIAQGCKVEWSAYRMPHTVCEEEIEALRMWLGAGLAPG